MSNRSITDTMISRSCADFLAEGGAGPEAVQRYCSSDHGETRGTYLVPTYQEGWFGQSMPINSPALVYGSLTCEREASRATLFLEYSWCKFNEQKNGLSVLTLFGNTLPESTCSGLRAGKYRLGDVIDCSNWKPRFFSSANPVVRTIRNVSRLQWRHAQSYERCAALAITMRDEWSHDHWAYQAAEQLYTDDPF